MEIYIKKGEMIPESVIKFFIGEKIINKYVQAGADIIIKPINDEKVSVEFAENINPTLKSVILKENKDLNPMDTECMIHIKTNDMEKDGYTGTITNIPSIHAMGRNCIVETNIKKGELIPEEIIKFFIDGKVINKYVSAGMDITIKKIDDDTIEILGAGNREYCVYIGGNSKSPCYIQIDTDSMQKDGEKITGSLTQKPSTIKFINNDKICVNEIMCTAQ